MTILVLDPSSHRHHGSTENIGDLIIKFHTNNLLSRYFHSDYTWVDYDSSFQSTDVIIVAGANVIGEVLHSPSSAVWQPNLFRVLINKPLVVPLGVGWWSYQPGPSFLTSTYYKRMLRHPDYPISVRDEYTQTKFHHMGFNNVFLSGCPSMYGHTSFSVPIPNKVLLTLTNYRSNVLRDLSLLDFLLNRFNEIVFFPQGSTDIDYLTDLLSNLKLDLSAVTVLPRCFDSLNHFIETNDVMHIGTRLHMNMHFLFFSKPSLCIEVDNRAIEMKRSFPWLPIISIHSLPSYFTDCSVFRFTPPSASFRSRFDSFMESIVSIAGSA